MSYLWVKNYGEMVWLCISASFRHFLGGDGIDTMDVMGQNECDESWPFSQWSGCIAEIVSCSPFRSLCTRQRDERESIGILKMCE